MIDWPVSLVTAIARRRAVVLIGSGVSANAKTDAGVSPPTWGAFLTSAYKKLGRRVSHISSALKRYDYLEACDYLRQEHGAEWPEIVRESFATPVYRKAPIHDAIFNLDSRIIVSLNFDKIYDTYAIGATEGTVIVKSHHDGDMRQALTGSDSYIVKPHGSIDSISQMIFTLTDYGEARSKYRSFYEVFNALLHTHTFICIGCGLSDPDLQLIFEDYRFNHNEHPHFMTLPGPVPAQQIELIKRTRGINVLSYSPKDGHKELTTSLEALVLLVNQRREEMAEVRGW